MSTFADMLAGWRFTESAAPIADLKGAYPLSPTSPFDGGPTAGGWFFTGDGHMMSAPIDLATRQVFENAGTSGITYSMWLNKVEAANQNVFSVRHGGTNNIVNMRLRVSSGSPPGNRWAVNYFHAWMDGSMVAWQHCTFYSDQNSADVDDLLNTWVHVVVRLTPASPGRVDVDCFFNNVPSITGTLNRANPSNIPSWDDRDFRLRVRRGHTAVGDHVGYIGETAIYGRVLTTGEIAEIASEGIAPAATPPPRPREPVSYIEIDQDRCDNIYGTAPCTATGTPDEKCYNTWKTCQDKLNYVDGTPLTVRLAVPSQSLARDIYAVPIVQSIQCSASRANIGARSSRDKALGKRSALTATCGDAPHSDALVDPYLDGRSWDPLERGTWWTKQLARNYYNGRPARYIKGYADQALVDMEHRHFVVDKIDGPDSNGTVVIRALDVLRLADDDKAQGPAPSRGRLRDALAVSGETSIWIEDATAADYPLLSSVFTEGGAYGLVRIGDEIIRYTAVDDSTGDVELSIAGRGMRDTDAAEHAIADSVQWCLEFDEIAGWRVAYILLTAFGGVPAAYIDEVEWEAEASVWLAGQIVSRTLTEPVGVTTLVGELCEQCGFAVWWEEREQEIRFQAVRPVAVDETIAEITEANNLVQRQTALRSRPEERASQVWISYDLVRATAPTQDRSSYRRHRLHIDADSASTREYGDAPIVEIYSPWIVSDAQARIVASRRLARIRDNPEYATFSLAAKDGDIAIADVIWLRFAGLVDAFGSPIRRLYQIISVAPVSESIIRCEAQVYEFVERYAGWVEDVCANTYGVAPCTASGGGCDNNWSTCEDRDNYVDAGLPEYNAASDEEKLVGVYWAQDVCLNTYGVAPCTASAGSCNNDWATCEDRHNYTAGEAVDFPDGGKPYSWI